MKPYPKYIDSGIEWIEKVPGDWSMLRLKYFVKINPSKTLTVLNENISGEVSFLPMEKVDSDGEYDVASMKPIEEVNNGFTCFKKNDVIFAKITPCFENGKGALLDKIKTNIGFGSTEFHVLRSIRDMSNPKYLYYITKTHPFRKMGEAFMSGSAGQKRVPSNFIENLFFPYSPLPEQKQLAKYLDHKTTQIDSLIEKKGRLIELLKEERTAVINQAVSKGLDSNVPMKDSGIEWMGEIPAHWKIKKVKHLTTKIGSGITPRGGSAIYLDAGIPLLRSQNVHFYGLLLDDVAYISEEIFTGMLNSEVLAGDVLLNITGASIGRCYYVDESLGKANVNQHVCIVRPKSDIETEYLYLILASDIGQTQVFHCQTGANREGLNFEQLKNFIVPYPNKEQRDLIINHIKKETARIDTIISKSEKEIELLQEYRTALISEVVTGKIDIREEKI